MLKSLLQTVLKGEDNLVLDYYGELFEIKPLRQKNKTQVQKIVQKYAKSSRLKAADDSIFNEGNSAQEKKNLREYLYGSKTQAGVMENN